MQWRDLSLSWVKTSILKLRGVSIECIWRRMEREFLSSSRIQKEQMDDSGTFVSFGIEGGRESVFRFLNALDLIDIANNLGDTKTLITHPATTTHQRLGPEERAKMGISDDLVRLSVGLEDVADITKDLDRGLKAARG